MNHSPRAQFDDAVLADAATIYAGLAVRRLEKAQSGDARLENAAAGGDAR